MRFSGPSRHELWEQLLRERDRADRLLDRLLIQDGRPHLLPPAPLPREPAPTEEPEFEAVT